MMKPERLGHGLGDTNGLSWSPGYAAVVGEQELAIGAKDRSVLRALAREVAELADRPEQGEKKSLWIRHNALEETIPLVFCDPENAWYEIIPASTLVCSTNLARIWEFRLRKELFWAREIRDDRVTEALFRVHFVAHTGTWGIEPRLIGAEGNGAYRWDPPLHDYGQVAALTFRGIEIDRERSDALENLARDVLGDILEVRREGAWWWSLGMTTDLVLLRGIERILYDLVDDPGGVHRLMAFLRDENLARLDFLEVNGLLAQNNGGDLVGTGGYGWSRELPMPGHTGGAARCRDMWGFCESQESIGVSPEMFNEFVLAYQLPLLSRFGLNIYGCCEPLDRRWEFIRRIPRLRRVTVSPWSDPAVMADNLGRDYVYCAKVNPSVAATSSLDEDAARASLRAILSAAHRRHCPVEVMLRDVMTVSGNPGNAIRWTRLAREEAARLYG